MVQKLTLYPVSLGGPWAVDRFDRSKLPFQIMPGVAVEEVSKLISERSFAVFAGSENLSAAQLKALSAVQVAIVHRYQCESKWLKDEEKDRSSIDLVHKFAACLLIVRPTRTDALIIQGDLEEWGFDASHFEHPVDL